MKKHFLKKLKSRAGETLVETLFAILIATFASVLLASATSTAMELNRQARERDKVTQTCLETLSTGQPEEKVVILTATVTVQPMKLDADSGEFVKQTDGDGNVLVQNISVDYTGCNVDGYGFGDFSTYQLHVDSAGS